MGAIQNYSAVNSLTDRCQSKAAFSHCSTTSNEPDNEKQSSNSNDGHCWDEGVHVFKEVIVVVICNEDISPNVTQDTSSCLQGNKQIHKWVLCPLHRIWGINWTDIRRYLRIHTKQCYYWFVNSSSESLLQQEVNKYGDYIMSWFDAYAFYTTLQNNCNNINYKLFWAELRL